MAALSAPDVLLVAFKALDLDDQEHAFALISDARLTRIAGDEGETARMIRSLRRIAEYVGVELTPDNYRDARKELIAEGEEIVERNALIRYFGSWRRAKEALSLSATQTPLKIEARFRARLLGKVHRYRDEKLEEAMMNCAEALGHAPLVVEFTLWRQRELELAKARGEELFLPSDSPYRRRWGSWENVLRHFGFSEDEIAGRLEHGREVCGRTLTGARYTKEAWAARKAAEAGR